MRMARKVAGISALASVSIFGCGDPVPPAAQAGVSIHVQEHDPMDMNHKGHTCPPARHWVNVPYDRGKTTSMQSQRTSANERGPMAVNNQDGNTVSCSVKPKGSTFSVSARGVGYAEDNMMKRISPSNVNISIPSIGNGDTSAPGSIAILDHASLVTYEASDCTFSTVGGQMGVEAGMIWARVTRCENLADPRSPGAVCLVDDGYFLFENCAK
jgi:hypothetical protein